jgi:hypothetical protein
MAYLTNLVLSSSGVGGISALVVGGEMGSSMGISLILESYLILAINFN